MKKGLVIFDGDCGICTWTSEWIEKKDRHGKLEVKPYQVLDLKKIDSSLSQELTQSSVYFVSQEGKIFSHARAIFEIGKRLPGIVGFLNSIFANRFFGWLFKPLYKLVAANRTRISKLFGLNACTLPGM